MPQESFRNAELTLNNIAGIFYILVLGLIVAIAVALFQFCYRTHSDQANSKVIHDVLSAVDSDFRNNDGGNSAVRFADRFYKYRRAGAVSIRFADTTSIHSTDVVGFFFRKRRVLSNEKLEKEKNVSRSVFKSV